MHFPLDLFQVKHGIRVFADVYEVDSIMMYFAYEVDDVLQLS